MAAKDKKMKKTARERNGRAETEVMLEDEPTTTELETKLGAVGIFILSCVIYFITMFPGLPMGDSGEFMVTAIDFGVAHPPGYPLFTSMAHLAIKLIPFGTPAWRVSLLSVLFGALFNVTVYYVVSLVGKNSVVGLMAAGWIGFSRLFWMWSIQGEIFSLNNFFCAFIMLRAYYFESCSKENILFEAKISALTCGLSLSNQHTSVLFIVPFALRVAYKVLIVEGKSPRDACNIAMYGIGGMAWYLQMPISHFFFTPRVTWGDFGSISTFLKHMLRLDYGSSFKLVAGDTQGTFISNFIAFVKDSSAELTVLPWAFALFLIYTVTTKVPGHLFRTTVKVFLAMMGCYFAVFCSLANIENPAGLSRGVLERFWMQPSIGLLILAGIGLSKFIIFLSEKVHPILKNKYLQLALAILIISVQIKTNYEENDESDNWYAHHYAQSILPELPENSILLTGGDLPTNVFRYHTICEQMRPDVRVMDMQFMAADWFRDVLAPTTFAGINVPGVYRPFKAADLVKGQYNLKGFLDANIDSFDIFVCNSVRRDEGSDYEVHYMLIPYRTCKRFVKRSDVVNPVEVVEKTPSTVLDEWPMPDIRKYEDRTWEHTLKVAYLNSLSEKGSLMWQEAVAHKNSNNLRYLLEHGAVLHGQGVSQIETAIADGRLERDDWQHVYTIMAKNMGHFCMILHTMVAAEGNETRRLELEECGRKYWTIYVNWSEILRNKDEVALVKELRRYLAMKSFKGLRFNI
ncbi:protein O-mannosyl-transferase TMEM260-like isoform X3 [Bolinopsis microptera]|uniref:protein O-mannosyl-transferase TMEM260-like isoform X3 n=1 Tax=Bolinopsis microptera TaxID=2820187 RepID=UPI00307AECAE